MAKDLNKTAWRVADLILRGVQVSRGEQTVLANAFKMYYLHPIPVSKELGVILDYMEDFAGPGRISPAGRARIEELFAQSQGRPAPAISEPLAASVEKDR